MKLSISKVKLEYYVFGHNLNSEELKLAALHPIAAVSGYNESSTLYKGNGDAFRHC